MLKNKHSRGMVVLGAFCERTLLTLLCVTLSSCVPVGTRDMNATSSPIAEIAPTATLTPVKIPTFTQISPPTATNMVMPQPTVGLTSTWTPSPTPITIDEIHTCQSEGVPAPLPDEFGFEGTMLYISDWGMYTVGGIPLIFSSEPIFDFGVGWLGDTFSPNGEWLIYRPATSTIGLVSYQGDWIENNLDFSDFSALADPGYMISGVRAHSWINNELVHALIDFREIGEGDGHYSYFAVLDPFTGNWRNDLVTRVPQWNRGSLGFRLSPDLTRVLYWDDHYDLVLADSRQPEGFIWKDRDYDYYTTYYIPAAWPPTANISHTSVMILDREIHWRCLGTGGGYSYFLAMVQSGFRLPLFYGKQVYTVFKHFGGHQTAVTWLLWLFLKGMIV